MSRLIIQVDADESSRYSKTKTAAPCLALIIPSNDISHLKSSFTSLRQIETSKGN